MSDSLPPELLRGYEQSALSREGGPSTTSGGGELVVTAGEPGTYEPELAAAERPRNVTELRERARPATREPWPAGAYVLVGTSGKRAHWDGDDWHGGESDGYTEEPTGDGGDEGAGSSDRPAVTDAPAETEDDGE